MLARSWRPFSTDPSALFLCLQVDGGVGPGNIGQCAHAGSNVIVAGSAVFLAENSGDVIKSLKAAVDEAIEARKQKA